MGRGVQKGKRAYVMVVAYGTQIWESAKMVLRWIWVWIIEMRAAQP